jgi:hypothetical protein
MRYFFCLIAPLTLSGCVLPNAQWPQNKTSTNASQVTQSVANPYAGQRIFVTNRTNLRAGWRLEVLRYTPSQEFYACTIVHDASNGYGLGIRQLANNDQELRLIPRPEDGRYIEVKTTITIDGKQHRSMLNITPRMRMSNETPVNNEEFYTPAVEKLDYFDDFKAGRLMTVATETPPGFQTSLSLEGSNDAAAALQNCVSSRGQATQPVTTATPPTPPPNRAPLAPVATKSGLTTAPTEAPKGAGSNDNSWDEPTPKTSATVLPNIAPKSPSVAPDGKASNSWD